VESSGTTKYGTAVQPAEAVSALDGIRMFTRWSAYANFLEGSRGTIEVNKLADLVVLRYDPTTAAPDGIDEIPVDLTILDGRVAYRAAH
jgi:predicted amidohydrolase YtcJ